MFRTAITRQARLFTTSTRLQKGPVELGKDALKKVDRVVSDAAVKGIETGGMFCSFHCCFYTVTIISSQSFLLA
jgi:hypothetical protein